VIRRLSERYAVFRRLPFEAFAISLRIKPEQRRRLARIISIAFVLQVTEVLTYLVVSNSLNLSLDVVDLMVFVPIIFLITILPITIGGVGLREFVCILLFQAVGLREIEAVSFSVAFLGLSLLFSAFGGVLYLVRMVQLMGSTR
jgi:uncharacterized membrane protein YbhN (UPF0104 family)